MTALQLVSFLWFCFVWGFVCDAVCGSLDLPKWLTLSAAFTSAAALGVALS